MNMRQSNFYIVFLFHSFLVLIVSTYRSNPLLLEFEFFSIWTIYYDVDGISLRPNHRKNQKTLALEDDFYNKHETQQFLSVNRPSSLKKSLIKTIFFVKTSNTLKVCFNVVFPFHSFPIFTVQNLVKILTSVGFS